MILFIMINIFNFLNYVFHFSMARMLTPADYGVLGVLMSLLYIYGIPNEAIQGIFSKYSSKFKSKQGDGFGKIKYLLSKGLKVVFIFSIVLFALATIGGIFLADFIDVEFGLIALVNLSIFGLLTSAVLRGILQGEKKFWSLSWSLIVETGFRLIIAIVLVLVGWRIFGAVIGLVTGFIFGVGFAVFSLKDLAKEKEEKVELKGIKGQSWSFLGAMVAIILIYSVDIILAKRFFPEEIVGQYTVISMLGKMIFFGTMPISKALLPISSESFSNGKPTKSLFYKSALFVALISGIALAAFLFVPKLIIWILFGSKYLDIAPYLIYVGIALTFLSFTNLVVIYGLSLDRFKRFYWLFIFVIIEITLFFIFNQNLLEFTLAFMFSNIIMFLGSLILIKIKN
jgi:O-antigen/teichoic acid export membrane protein